MQDKSKVMAPITGSEAPEYLKYELRLIES